MAAGLGFKTFTSGEVLTAADTNGYLMQGILVFANASARTAAITSPQEGQFSYLKDTNSTEYYDGSAWVAGVEGDISGVTAGTGISGGGTSGTVTVTNSMATTITTKGDLVPGTGSGTFARLAVGNNGESLVADSSTSTGLRYQGNFAAGKNKIINGDFGIWQRGTSFTTTSNTYTADRWTTSKDGSGTVTTSQQTFTAGTAPVSGYEGTYFLQLATSVLGTTTYNQLQQKIEDVRTFAGQTVTVSFWAKLSSGTVGSAYVRLNQNFGSGGSATVFGSANNYTPTGSWQRFSATVTLASISGKTIGTGSMLEVDFVTPFTATNTMQFWGVQLEAGSVATAFQTATGTIQGELAACQRYYWRNSGASANNVILPVCGSSGSSTTPAFVFQPPVTMRVAPTSIDFANLQAADQLAGYALSSLAINATSQPNLISITASATGLTAYRPLYINASTSNAYLGFSAEL